MLENIRENSSGVVAWGIAILIIITMAFFGVSSYVSSDPEPVLAEVGGRSITQYEFNNAFQNWQRSTQQRLGQNNSVDLNSQFFRMQTLDRLINQELVAELSEKGKYRVSDKQVADVIRQDPRFQTDGQFDDEIYTRFATASHRSKANFENYLRQNLSTRQVLSGLGDSAFVLPSKLQDVLSLRAQTREFDLVRFSIDEYAKDVQISDADTEAYYQANLERFNEEEKMSVQYLRFAATDLEQQIEVSEDDLQLAYEQSNAATQAEAKREVRHILLAGDDAQTTANDVVARLQAGEDFAAMATELSQDPGSAAQGGSLGLIERGQMVPSFDEAAFNLAVNTISEPIQSQFGYHVIEVTKIDAPEVKTFAEMRDELQKEERQRQAEELFFEQIEQLKNLVFENPESLDAAAQELGLTVQTSDTFTRGSGSGIATNPAVRNAAFADDVLQNDVNSDVIELAPTEYVAIRKGEYTPTQPQALETVKTQIVELLSAEKAAELIAEKSTQALQQIQETENWGGVLDELSLTAEAQSFSYVDTSSELPADLLSSVFSASDATFANSVGKALDAQGNAFLFKLNGVVEATSENVTEAAKDSTERILQGRSGGASIAAKFLQDKRQEIDVEVNEDLL